MVRVRVADEGDCREIARVHVASWKKAYAGIMPDELLSSLDPDARAEDWMQELRHGDGTAVVAVRAGVVLGFSYFSKARDDDAGENVGEIQAIYVDPTHWRSGVGRKLLDESLSRMRALGCEKVILWVLCDNAGARRFYRVTGFREDGAQKQHPDTGLDEVRYEIAIG